MDRQNGAKTLGALRSTHLMENRHRSGHCDHSGEQDRFYRPEWLNRQDFALLTAFDEVDAKAGEAICFCERCGCGQRDHVLLTVPGIYYAAYTLHIPEGQELNTELALDLENRMLSESHLRIRHDCGQEEHVMAHALFEVRDTSRLFLRTRCDFHLCGERNEPIVTLVVFRIG